MEIRTFAELITPDRRSLGFTSRGLAMGGILRPEDAAEFQQRSIASADLIPAVSDGTRKSFERLRGLHSYGVLFYDAFTVAEDLTLIVLEQAIRERFIEFYAGAIPLVDKRGVADVLQAADFETVSEAFRRGGNQAKGWRLQLRSSRAPISMPLTLRPLLLWARLEGLVHGQRNKRVELEIFDKIRNRFAHGAGFRLGMPNESARSIRDLGEIVNRLWGSATPGGRLYPAAVQREVLVVGWSEGWGTGEQGSSVIVMHGDQLGDQVDPGGWTYLVLLGAWHDEMREFDARYEMTAYPVDVLWGPGTREEALAWLAATAPAGDEVEHLDRLFAVRRDGGKVYIPCRPEVFLGLPEAARGGVWHLVRADFAADGFEHIRHIEAGESCRGQRYGGCAVEDNAQGSWTDVANAVSRLLPSIRAAPCSDFRIPRYMSFPDSVGY